jgi:hypothetical protein
MHICALADGQILTILSYLVDYNIYEHYDKKQKIEQDRFERRFKRLFPHSHAQMLDEKAMRREILRPAQELFAYSLVCKQFRDVISNPAQENLLYSGITESLMKEYQLLDCGPDVEDALIGREIFTELFIEKNLEVLHRTGAPVRIQHDNHDPSKGFWHGKTAEALKTPKHHGYSRQKPVKNVTYSTVTISDQDRAAYLRVLKTGERNFDY